MKKIDPTIAVGTGMWIEIEFFAVEELYNDFAFVTDGYTTVDETYTPCRQLFFCFIRFFLERERDGLLLVKG